MARKRVKVNKETSTAIRLSISSELWRKFRAGCLYMDKDVNSELDRLLENWVKEWHKRIIRPESLEEGQGIGHHKTENTPFSTHSDYPSTSGEGGGSI